MARVLAGVAAFFLLLTGAVLTWRGQAEEPTIPSAPKPRLAAIPGPTMLSPIPAAPEADAKSREERRFGRADKDKNGQITLAELVEPRRKAFAKLDLNRDGRLSFEEWAVKSIDKFQGADSDKNKWLTPAEYATTAPKPRKKPACSC
jgi:hypothetical protein